MVTLSSGFDSLEVEVHYLAPDDEPLIRKWIVIRSLKAIAQTVKRLEVERFRVDGAKPAGTGYGLPVFLEDTFLGLEFPAGLNEYRDGRVSLAHFPGKNLAEPLRSRTAVWGVSPRGKVLESFRRYIVRSESAEGGGRSFRFALSGREPGEGAAVAPIAPDSILSIAERVGELDSFLAPPGWFNPRSWWEPDPGIFPGGFQSLTQKLGDAGVGLGLVLSPSGRGLDAAWAVSEGLLPSAAGSFCLGDSGWYKQVVGRLMDLRDSFNVNLLEFDHNNLLNAPGAVVCNSAGHGHATGATYAVEAGIDSLVSIIAALKRADSPPELIMGRGVVQSPWWLTSADYLRIGGGDVGFSAVPSLSDRSRAITYHDSFFYQSLVLQNSGIPLSGYVTPGIVKYDEEVRPGSSAESIVDWTNNLVMTVGRGCGMVEMLVDSGKLNRREQEMLGRVLAWARGRQELLLAANSRMFGSNPAVGDPYGYAHLEGDRGLIFIRNPSVEAKSIRIDLFRELGFRQGGGGYLLRTIYPVNRVLVQGEPPKVPFNLNLIPDEVRVLEIVPLSEVDEPYIAGPGYVSLGGDGPARSFEIMTRSVGGGRRAVLYSVAAINSYRVDGNETDVDMDEPELTFDFDGGRPGGTRGYRADLDRRGGGARFSCRLKLDPNLRETQLVLAVKGLDTGRIRVADWRLNGEAASYDRIGWGEQRASDQLVTPVYPPHELFLRTHLSGREAAVVVDLAGDQPFMGSLSAYLIIRRRPVTSIVRVTPADEGVWRAFPPSLPGFDTLGEIVPLLPAADLDLTPQ
jgi:hypothetical protein